LTSRSTRRARSRSSSRGYVRTSATASRRSTVVVADQEDPIGRCGQGRTGRSCARSTSWTSSTRSSPHRSRQREATVRRFEPLDRTKDQVVEVEAAAATAS
jgi:hypothetical protein